jgi:tripartite-type tricarboxylate transporter receptor subunit TctC
MGPAQLPREVVQILNAGIAKSLATPEVRERLLKAGFTPAPSTPDELRTRYEDWIAIFGKIAKDVGLKPQ